MVPTQEIVLVSPVQKHVCYTTATCLDENGDMLSCRSPPKTSIDMIWVTWEVRVEIPTNKVHKLMETLSQISIRHLTHTILNKRK